eukprot:m.214108 g.214108  ORF g.214108 m.214108 type:complete len:536 (+) comp15529_c0_seq13:2239-3846(+)
MPTPHPPPKAATVDASTDQDADGADPATLCCRGLEVYQGPGPWDTSGPGRVTEAVRMLHLAADGGSTEAAGHLAYLRTLFDIVGEVPPTALSEAVATWQRDAAGGSAPAQYYLARCHACGLEVPKDDAEMFRLFSLAADSGHPLGQFGLGMCYKLGRGVGQDVNRAVRLFERSAAQGHLDAVAALGRCYEDGHGVTRFLPTAVVQYRTAADQGNPMAQAHLGRYWMRQSFGVGGTRTDAASAERWLRLSADQGHPIANYNLGLLLLKVPSIRRRAQRGGPEDVREAEGYSRFQRAATHGHSPALRELGMCHIRGMGVDRIDYAEGVRYLRLAADHGDSGAMYQLGFCHAKAIGVPKDLAVAVRWYRQSAEAGNSEAWWMVAEAYRHGRGVQKDPEIALKFYRLLEAQLDAPMAGTAATLIPETLRQLMQLGWSCLRHRYLQTSVGRLRVTTVFLCQARAQSDPEGTSRLLPTELLLMILGNLSLRALDAPVWGKAPEGPVFPRAGARVGKRARPVLASPKVTTEASPINGGGPVK